MTTEENIFRYGPALTNETREGITHSLFEVILAAQELLRMCEKERPVPALLQADFETMKYAAVKFRLGEAGQLAPYYYFDVFNDARKAFHKLAVAAGLLEEQGKE